jgi:hypothetical protein
MKSRQSLINYLLFNTKNYFKDSEELLRLEKIHRRPSWMIFFEMWITPLLFIFSIFITSSAPSVLSLLSLYKCICTWLDHYRYKELLDNFDRWQLIVDSLGGPFVATNSMRYMPYVYADGMQRIHNFIFKRHTSPRVRPTQSNPTQK